MPHHPKPRHHPGPSKPPPPWLKGNEGVTVCHNMRGAGRTGATSSGRGPAPRGALLRGPSRPPPQEAETTAPTLRGDREGLPGLVAAGAEGPSPPPRRRSPGGPCPGAHGAGAGGRDGAARRPWEQPPSQGTSLFGRSPAGKVHPQPHQGPSAVPRSRQRRDPRPRSQSRGMTAGSESILSSGRPPASSSNCRGYRWWRPVFQKLPGHSPRPPSSSVEVGGRLPAQPRHLVNVGEQPCCMRHHPRPRKPEMRWCLGVGKQVSVGGPACNCQCGGLAGCPGDQGSSEAASPDMHVSLGHPQFGRGPWGTPPSRP